MRIAAPACIVPRLPAQTRHRAAVDSDTVPVLRGPSPGSACARQNALESGSSGRSSGRSPQQSPFLSDVRSTLKAMVPASQLLFAFKELIVFLPAILALEIRGGHD